MSRELFEPHQKIYQQVLQIRYKWIAQPIEN